MHIRPFARPDQDAVIRLWRECGLVRPWNDPERDIARKLTVQPELFLIGEHGGALVAAAMAGYDGHRGWVNYLAVSPGHQRQGFARQLMGEIERLLTERGCPKLNLQIRADNTQVKAFYAHLGYAEDAAIAMGKRLIADA